MKFVYWNVLLFIVPASITALLMPFVLWLAARYGMYDRVCERKIHTRNIPRLGGMAIFLGVVFTLIAMVWVPDARQILIDREAPLRTILVLVASAALVHYLGLGDDIAPLKARYKLIVQLAAAALVIFSGCTYSSFCVPFSSTSISLGWLGIIISLVWIVGVVNAVNLIDGLDGLAGGISLVSLIGFGIIADAYGAQFSSVLSVVVAGAVAGFLLYNFPPARIFMGDSGSLFLGFVAAVLPLSTPSLRESGLMLPSAVLILIVPISDTIAAIIRRVLQGRHFFSPDREHLHHKLLDLGLSSQTVLMVLLGWSLAGTAAAILFALTPGIGSSILALSILALTVGAHIVLHTMPVQAVLSHNAGLDRRIIPLFKVRPEEDERKLVNNK